MESEAILKEILSVYGMNTAISVALIAFLVSTITTVAIDRWQQNRQASLDSKIHISKIQYDVEYKAYQEIWAALVEVRNTVLLLRPLMDSYGAGKSREDVKIERLGEFGAKFNYFSNLVEKNKPFYAPDVYGEMHKIRQSIRSEAVEYEFGDHQLDSDYWDKAIANQQIIVKLIDSTCDAIRTRLASISVID